MRIYIRKNMMTEHVNGISKEKVRIDLVLLYMFAFYFVNRTLSLDTEGIMTIVYARISLVMSLLVVTLYIVKNRKLTSYDAFWGFGVCYVAITIFSTLINGGDVYNAISAGYPYIAVPCLVGLTKANKKELTVALAFLCYILTTVNFIDAIFFKDLTLQWGRVVSYRLLLGGANQLGIKFAFCITMMLMYSDLVRTRLSKFMLVTTILMNLYLTYKTWSATTIVSIVIFLILIIPAVQNVMVKIDPKVILILLVGSHFLFATDLIQNFLKRDITMSGRTRVWAEGLLLIKKKWLLGYGVRESVNVVLGLSMHNELLQRLYEGGILCVLPLFSSFLKGFSKDNKDKTYGYFMAATIAVMLVQLTEAPSSNSFFLISLLAYIYTVRKGETNDT